MKRDSKYKEEDRPSKATKDIADADKPDMGSDVSEGRKTSDEVNTTVEADVSKYRH